MLNKPKAFRSAITAILLFLALLTITPLSASAHPGGTNADGGHWDYDTGEYHYHHGYSAHDHYDTNGDGVIDCPYDFDDQTGINSGISSPGNTSSSTRSYFDYTPAETVTVYKDKEVIKEVPFTPTWIKWALGISLFCLFVSILHNIRQNSEFKKKLDSQTFLQNQSEKEIQKNLTQFNVDATQIYGNSYLYRLCGAPHGDYIGTDNLPAAYYGRDHKWGEKYTFYSSRTRFDSTKRIHKASCRYVKYQNPVNAYTLRNWSNIYNPCHICNPEIPDMTWVDKYLNYKKFLTKYSIETPAVDIEKEIGDNPMMGFVTQEMLEDTALEMGVSLQTALLLINQERRLYGIPELNANQFDM